MQYTEVESEVRDFLRLLVRALRPQYVIETGTLHGMTAREMALELSIGAKLDTIENDYYNAEMANAVLSGLAEVHHMDSRDFIPDRPINLAFLDSDPHIRFQEAEHFRPFLAPDGLIAIHDSRDLPRPTDWRWVQLPTPRGLLLLQHA